MEKNVDAKFSIVLLHLILMKISFGSEMVWIFSIFEEYFGNDSARIFSLTAFGILLCLILFQTFPIEIKVNAT